MFILAILLLSAMAWGWLMRVTVREIDVRNTVNADAAEVRELAEVDSGDVLFDISPRLVADRVSRLPWVRAASITRLPTGRLIVSIEEREPVVRVLTQSGRQEFYLDRDGYQMPPTDAASYDVPLLTGYPEKYHPVTPTSDADVIEMLAALDTERESAGVFISEVLLRDKELWLQLEPAGKTASTPVRLGTGDIAAKLRRLSSFWEQRITLRQDRIFDLIDLRFSSQIITKEKGRD